MLMGNNTNTEELAASMAWANAQAAQATQAAQAAKAAKAAIPVHAPISAPISQPVYPLAPAPVYPLAPAPVYPLAPAPVVYIQVHAPLVHAPPPHVNIQPPPPSASQEQVAQYAELITTNLAEDILRNNTNHTQHRQQILNALENEVRARVALRVLQRRMSPMNPNILQQIVIQTRNSYLFKNYSQNYVMPPIIAVTYVRDTLDETISPYLPSDSYVDENDNSFFSNTTKLEPFWNVTQTQTEAVRNAECNNNTLPIGVYLSNNMSMYASIKY